MKQNRYTLLLSFFGIFICCSANAQIITTVAGNGMAGYSGDGFAATGAKFNFSTFLQPDGSGVVTDHSGNFYIADEYNNVIRKVNSAGIISTIIGTGYGAGGIAASGTYNGDGIPATAADLNSPSGLAIDAAGNIYIADYWNIRVRKVNTSGVISTIAGNGTQGYTGDGSQATAAELGNPNSVAVDASGNVYFSDDFNHVVRKVSAATGVITTIAGTGTPGYSGDGTPAMGAQLYRPWGLAFDAAGNLYIADCWNNRIRKVDASGTISTVAGNGISAPFGGDGIAATATTVSQPRSIAFDAAGNYYIAESGGGRIRKVNTSNIISTVAGDGSSCCFSGDGAAATLAQLDRPVGVALDDAGSIYIVDQDNERIRKVTSSVVASISAAATTACQDSCITFTNTSTGTIDSIRWSAPGITIATPHSSPVSICFPAAGANTVTLTVYSGGTPYTATSTVTVNPAPHPVITHAAHTLSVGAGYTSYQWYNGSTAITGAITNSYTYTTSGAYTVVVDSAGCAGKSTFSTLGVQQIAPGNTSITLIPNPNTGVFTIKGNLSSSLDQKVTLEVTNMIGNVVYSKAIDAPQGEINTQVSVNDHLPNGLYLLKLSTSREINVSHFVIER